MAEDSFFMSTASENFCLYFRDISPDNVILAKTDDGNWKVGITCRDAWSMTETVAASPLYGYGEGCRICHTTNEPKRPSRAPHAQFPRRNLSLTTIVLPPIVLITSRILLEPAFCLDRRDMNSRRGTKMQKLHPRRHLKYYEQQIYDLGKWSRRLMHYEMFLVRLAKSPDEYIDNFTQGWADYATIHGLATQSERL